jgi:hypothetical protein
MRTVWIGVWLSLGFTAIGSGISYALNDAEQRPFETPADVSATPPLDTSAGAIPADSFSDTRPRSPENVTHIAGVSLTQYVFLHKTRNEHTSPKARSQVNACPNDPIHR